MARTKRLSTLWTKQNTGLLKDQALQADFEAYVRNSKTVLDVVVEVINKKISEAEKGKDEDYEKAAWPFLMADRQGQIRAYNYIKEMIDL